jgi:hypothetical protein
MSFSFQLKNAASLAFLRGCSTLLGFVISPMTIRLGVQQGGTGFRDQNNTIQSSSPVTKTRLKAMVVELKRSFWLFTNQDLCTVMAGARIALQKG